MNGILKHLDKEKARMSEVRLIDSASDHTLQALTSPVISRLVFLRPGARSAGDLKLIPSRFVFRGGRWHITSLR
jgi:hypothetical protein